MNSSNLRIPKPCVIVKSNDWFRQLEKCRQEAQNPMIKNFISNQYFETQGINLTVQSQA